MSSISPPLDINSKGQLKSVLPGIVDDSNSSSDILGAGESFVGAAVNVLDIAIIFVTVYSDKASATDGLKIEMSSDGVTWHSGQGDLFTIPASTQKTFSLQPHAKFYRVSYVNGGADQTVFDLQSILKGTNSKPSSHRIQDSIIDDDDAELVKAVLAGKNSRGEFNNFSSTNRGNFKIAVQEYGDTPSIDAFARLRTSEPYTVFDSKQLHDKQPLFWDESIGGSATSTHNAADANVEMTVTANAADFVIRQTKQRFNYQPGKSQLIFFTFISDTGEGLTQRMGPFDGTGANNLTPNNGIFFEDNGSPAWKIAKNGSITESATQEQWNIDALDGTGDSEKTLDLSAPQIGVIDYEWLGLGRVRVGFVIDGTIVYCHYFNHANNPSFDSVYMSSPNLPIRYSIETLGTSGGTLRHVCSTVISEGGIEKTGVLRTTNTGSTHVDADAIGTIYAVLGIRLKSNYRDITVQPESMSMISETNDDFRWALHLNPTLSSALSYSDKTNSAVQEARGATANTITDEGIVLASGYASTASQSANEALETALNMGSKIDGTMDEIVLSVMPLSANADIQASLNFRELL